jgi:type IV secretion system protein VirB10
MRTILTLLLVSGMAFAQSTEPVEPKLTPARAANASDKSTEMTSAPAGASIEEASDPNVAVIPSGTKVPLVLKQAISTKNAREGDPVYAETAFPFVVNNRILIPAGTYIQGKISHTEHAGRSKKPNFDPLHIDDLSDHTVMLPGYIQNTPGADDKGVKDSEGTIQADKDTGKRIEDAAKGAAVGGSVGSVGGLAAGGLNGARYGGLAGIAGGVAWALLKHGPEVKLEVGTSLEMEIQRDVKVDASRIQMAKAQ